MNRAVVLFLWVLFSFSSAACPGSPVGCHSYCDASVEIGCPIGTFAVGQSIDGSFVLTNCASGCPQDQYAVACADGGGRCSPCPTGARAPSAPHAFQGCSSAIPGFYMVDGFATECGAGHACPGGASGRSACTPSADNPVYAPGPRAQACARCTPGSYITYDAAGHATGCAACPADRVCADGFRARDCHTDLPGLRLVDGACQACPAGQYSADGAACTICAADEYVVALPLPSGKFSVSCGSVPNGMYPSGRSALVCPAGHACADGAKSGCTGAQWSAEGASLCKDCPAGSVVAGDHASCGCPAGFEALSTGCTPCPAGQYQPTQGQTSCLECPAGTTSGAGSNACHSILPASEIAAISVFVALVLSTVIVLPWLIISGAKKSFISKKNRDIVVL